MRLTHQGRYPREWPQLSYEAKAAAGWRCVRCLHPFAAPEAAGVAVPEAAAPPAKPGQMLPCDERCDAYRCAVLRRLVRVNFTVHHLDGDKGNCVWWNLLATCSACHLSIQARVIPERPYLLDHSAWFRPYVAGFYAQYYGGQAITRAEALAHPERWLALGQPWLSEARP